VLLANTYSAAGKWEESTHIWSEMTRQNIKKVPGMTWVTINGKTETFYVDSWDHPYPICHSMLLLYFDKSLDTDKQ
jgi:hypothetical protein